MALWGLGGGGDEKSGDVIQLYVSELKEEKVIGAQGGVSPFMPAGGSEQAGGLAGMLKTFVQLHAALYVAQ